MKPPSAEEAVEPEWLVATDPLELGERLVVVEPPLISDVAELPVAVLDPSVEDPFEMPLPDAASPITVDVSLPHATPPATAAPTRLIAIARFIGKTSYRVEPPQGNL
jgi:hypothetical protein